MVTEELVSSVCTMREKWQQNKLCLLRKITTAVYAAGGSSKIEIKPETFACSATKVYAAGHPRDCCPLFAKLGK